MRKAVCARSWLVGWVSRKGFGVSVFVTVQKSNRLGPEGAEALVRALEKMTGMQSLDLVSEVGSFREPGEWVGGFFRQRLYGNSGSMYTALCNRSNRSLAAPIQRRGES
jgi:hypothetical protein